jgi:putative transposase
VAYRIVLAEKARTPVSERTPVAVACELLGVSTSGFYDWAGRAPSDRELSDAWLVEKIKTVHAENRGVYGSRRVTAELRLGEGVVVSRKRVQRLMRAAGLSGLTKVKRGRTTIRVPGVRVADDLVERRFRPDRPGLSDEVCVVVVMRPRCLSARGRLRREEVEAALARPEPRLAAA